MGAPAVPFQQLRPWVLPRKTTALLRDFHEEAVAMAFHLFTATSSDGAEPSGLRSVHMTNGTSLDP